MYKESFDFGRVNVVVSTICVINFLNTVLFFGFGFGFGQILKSGSSH